jgi:hypothetical protein
MRTTTRPSPGETVRAARSPVAPATAIRTVSRPSHGKPPLTRDRAAPSDSEGLPDGRMFINGVYCSSAFDGREFTGRRQ